MCVYVEKKKENLNWKKNAGESRQGHKKVWLSNNGIWEKAKDCYHEMKMSLLVRNTGDKQMNWKISDK